MPISSIPAPRSSDETYKSTKGILDRAVAQRLRLARDNSKEPLIKKSSATVLEAEELVSSIFADMGISYEPTDSIPLTTNEPVHLVLKPKAGTSGKLPEHNEEMAEWDALHEEIRSKLSSLRLLH